MIEKHRERLFSSIKKNFPIAEANFSKGLGIGPHVFSPFVLEIPKACLEEIRTFISTIEQIKNSTSYQESLADQDWIFEAPKNPSLFTCFDFHYGEEAGLKLIEINTNASFYAACSLQNGLKTQSLPGMDLLYDNFKQAFQFTGQEPVVIFDENPKGEANYFEFLLYQDWLRQKGHNCEILNLKEVQKTKQRNIYNRFTDFYFERADSRSLKQDYLQGRKLFSPNPLEYYLLADKKRLETLRAELEKHKPELAAIIPKTLMFRDFQDKETLWQERKKYFFKPSQSHGGKGAFKGKSISRKAFENLYSDQFIAQEYCPPGKRTFETPEGPQDMKFDLRIFSFKGQVQNWGARLYQGQTTNMKTPWGGLATIEFV